MVVLDQVSDSDDSDNFEWDSHGEAEASWAPALRNFDAPGPSTLVRQGSSGWAHGESSSTSLVEQYVGMGFPKEMVLECIQQIGHSDQYALVEMLLTYKVLDADAAAGNSSASGCAPLSVEDDDDLDFEDWDDDDDDGDRVPGFDSSDDEDILQEPAEKDKKIKLLLEMGFLEADINVAITRCGVDADLSVLTDSVSASQYAGADDSRNFPGHEVIESIGERRERLVNERKKKRKLSGGGTQVNRALLDGSHDEEFPLPNPMIGFNLPGYMMRSVRMLPDKAIGPPFFYYENVALAPKGTWPEISRSLYGIKPEFVDSKYLSAAARKRGYVHNLPIANRSPLRPLPPKTIFEAFPHYQKYWPSWDPRDKMNCLQTCVGSAKLTERIQRALARSDSPPAPGMQKYVMNECRTWNLVWVGKNRVAPLEPDEYEYLLGFPRNHTRGVCKQDRYKALGNSFQVDTVAYHLSVLKNIFPNGINVLSLFSGIGGAEVALDRLGIHMKTVVSVEKNKVSRRILRGWWDQTQSGELVEIDDVNSVTEDRIASWVSTFGPFDLVIGGSPCNNLAGSNRHHRVGLDGDHSVLFYEYTRILDVVMSMRRL